MAELYNLSWSNKNPRTIRVGEYDIPMPDEPKKREQFQNHEKPKREQKFTYTEIPKDLKSWDEADREAFIEAEYHKRRNGIWIYVNGNKLWITGVHYFFLNYWTTKKRKRPDFRYADVEFFWLWDWVVRNPNVYGLVDFKGRRVGDTEKALCILYEYASRVRTGACGMQSLTLDHTKKAYQRLLNGHRQMVWFFKPINKGSTGTQEMLEFRYPESIITTNKIRKRSEENMDDVGLTDNIDFTYPHLDSEISHKSSSSSAYDMYELNRYYYDEFGKAIEANPIETWGMVKATLSTTLGSKIVGKGLFTSTIEEIGLEGATLKNATYFWEKSDPAQLAQFGKTLTGLVRVFRSIVDCTVDVDEYGYPKREEAAEIIKKTCAQYIAMRDFAGLMRYKRQNPTSIEDVLMSSAEFSQFNVENLQQRKFRLLYEFKEEKWKRGDLMWEDGIFNPSNPKVVWVPNPNGKWVISQHPEAVKGCKANMRSEHSRVPRPVNGLHFCGGVDTYDQKGTLDTDPSKGAIVIRRKFDANVDGDKFDDNGDALDAGEEWETSKYVCSYLYRHDDPYDFYEDVIKTVFYYSCPFLFEKNKGAIQSYVENRGFGAYIMPRPAGTMTEYAKQSKNPIPESGITANDYTITQYFELLARESVKTYNTIDHPEILDQLTTMNMANRGKKDLGVAAGWAHVAEQKQVTRMETKSDAPVEWFDEYVI